MAEQTSSLGVVADKSRDFFNDYFIGNVDSEIIQDLQAKHEKEESEHLTGTRSLAVPQQKLDLLNYVRESVVGTNDMVPTPFGPRKLTYCDYTASGRALSFIEEYIQNEVLPLYANTHTLGDATGLQTTLSRHEARDIIKRGCRGSIDDALLFVGTGATAGINALVKILDIQKLTEPTRLAVEKLREEKRKNAAADKLMQAAMSDAPREELKLATAQAGMSSLGADAMVDSPLNDSLDAIMYGAEFFNEATMEFATGCYPRVVVFVGPYEHHSNILPWRESGALVRVIPEAPTGGLDQTVLEKELKRWSAITLPPPLLIGAFSAASNVTGILEDTLGVTALLNQYGALSVWDYAAAAPYVPIDMNPMNDSRYKKSAIVFSPHKFVGGVSTPGVLLIKKRLLQTRSPHRPGGGTVLYVTAKEHVYLSNFEEREEGGTPEIIGSIRCGLVFQLRESIGAELIYREELRHARRILSSLSTHPLIHILGHQQETAQGQAAGARLPIVSFVIRYAPDPALLLHHNFVAALLNDLFGIQTRAGCACAGPYSQALLGIRSAAAADFLKVVIEKQEIMRPGAVRFNINYFASKEEAEFVLRAIHWVAEHGWKLLPFYCYVVASGEVKHRSRLTKTLGRRWLSSVSYISGKMQYSSMRMRADLAETSLSDLYAKYLAEADACVTPAALRASLPDELANQASALSPQSLALRWFPLTHEALADVKQFLALTEGKTISAAELHSVFGVMNPSARYDHSRWLQRPQTAIQPHYAYLSGLLSEYTRPSPTIIAESTSASSFDTEMKVVSAAGDSSSSKPGKQACLPCLADGAELVNAHRRTSAIIEEPQMPNGQGSKDIMDRLCQNCFHEHKVAESSVKGASNARECDACECVFFVPRIPVKKHEVEQIQKKMAAKIGDAIHTFNMIQSGDRIMVGVSGGKDSLTLIHMLLYFQRRSPVKFELAACTVDPQAPEYDPSILKNYFAALGVKYFYESQDVIGSAKKCLAQNPKVSICAFCSRMRRGILYSACRREGYNVLALGQHLDDLAESFVMSCFHNGSLRTMKVNYTNKQKDVRIIRPLCFVREAKTKEYARAMHLPVISENCPACFEAPKERQRVKLMLAAQETIHPNLHSSLLRAMMPLLKLASHDATIAALAAGNQVTATAAGEAKQSATASAHDAILQLLKMQQEGDEDDDERPQAQRRGRANTKTQAESRAEEPSLSSRDALVSDGMQQTTKRVQLEQNTDGKSMNQ